MRSGKTPRKKSSRKRPKYATIGGRINSTPNHGRDGASITKSKNKSTRTTKTPSAMSRARSTSNALLAAASSPTSAVGRCAETLKRSFSDPSASANINVYVRVKPTEQADSTTEPTEHEEPSFNVESENTLVHRICGQQGKRFLMDKIFEENSTQQELFETIGKTQVDNALSGYNNSIFAYGQTGTGKTYTMLGPNGGHGDLNDTKASQSLGLIPRILHYLFESINKAQEAREESNTNVNTVNKVTISYMEIYQENVRDLLDPNVDHPTNLVVKEHKRDGPFVKNLIETVVTTPKEALALMELGNSSRTQAKTRMNDTSSRSHAVFTIRIDGHMKSTAADGRKRKFTSKMNLVDLAGSERQRNTGATGKRLREGSAINKSLSVLGTVIMNLVDIGDGKSRHVHYRDSKLTFLLKDSLGGSTFTSIVATITPKEEHAQETLSTLHFAQRAKSVKNVVTRNVTIENTVSGLRKEIRTLKRMMSESAMKKNKHTSAPSLHSLHGRAGVAGVAGREEDMAEVKEGGDCTLQELAVVKLNLNQELKKSAQLKSMQMKMEQKMNAVMEEQRVLREKAQAREQELDQMRMEHARVVSERRRSSIGVTGRGGGRRESTLYSIVEQDTPRQAATATATTQTPTVHLITRKEAALDTEKAVKAALVSASSGNACGNTSREAGEEEEDVEARIEARIEARVEEAVANAVATTVCVKEEELRRAVEALQGQLKEQQRVFQTRLQRIQAKQKSDMKEFKDLKKSQHTTATALANAKDEALVKEKQYQRDLKQLRKELKKKHKQVGAISQAASVEQKQFKQLNEKVVALTNQLKDSQDEANILRDCLKIKQKKTTLAGNNKTNKPNKTNKTTTTVVVKNIKKQQVKKPTLTIPPSAPATAFAAFGPSSGTSPLMSTMVSLSLNAGGASSNPNSAMSMLAQSTAHSKFFGVRKKDKTAAVENSGGVGNNGNARESSSSIGSNGSRGSRGKHSLRNIFQSATKVL